MLSFITGLAAGCVHVVAGPDHLAAVAPMAAERPGLAARTGFKWGLGHGIGACFIGFLAIAFRQMIDVEAVSSWMEFLVGFMLLGIGVWAIMRTSRIEIHVHQHQHDGDEHKHIHVHDADANHEAEGHSHSHAAVYVGALHGAAGTGHLLAVLPSLAMPALDATLYLSAYLLGAVASMTLFGWVLGYVATGRRLRWSMYASALASIAIGGYWIATTWPGAAS